MAITPLFILANVKATDCGYPLVTASSWLGRHGVDVHSNGADQNSGNSCGGGTETYDLTANPAQYGYAWQCVELVNRLYNTKGWSGKLMLTGGHAKSLYTDTANGNFAHLTAHANGSGYIPVPGDVIVHSNGTDGHVAVVDYIAGSTLYSVEENASDTGKNSYTYDASTGAVSRTGVTISGYVHSDLNVPVSASASFRGATSTEDASYSGDFNGDGWNDTLIVHQRSDGGADIHILYGNQGAYMFQNSGTYIRSLTGVGGSGWDWSKMKFAAGRFNDDKFSDLAILQQRADGGADLHVLYGDYSPTTLDAPVYVRSLTGVGGSGWDWSKMKVVSGDFNGDGWDDILIGHQRSSDGGMDIHVLYGNQGAYMFSNSTTYIRSLSGPTWDWTKMKLATGRFNSGQFSDLAVLYQRADNGADVHILYGGPAPNAVDVPAYVRSLSGVGGSGWDWSKMKLVSGDFNNDAWDDIAVMHQRSDGGADVHMLYGNEGPYMFQNSSTYLQSLTGTGGSGWDWSKMKLAAGTFNQDNNADIAIFHRSTDGGLDVYVMYGITSANSLYTPAYVRSLTGVGGSGWDWTKAQII